MNGNNIEEQLKAIFDKLQELETLDGIRTDFKEMRDQLRGMRVEMEKLRSDIGEVEKTLSERIEDLDTNLNTVVYHQQKIGTPYIPVAPEYTPTGHAVVEPKHRWVRDHPYRK